MKFMNLKHYYGPKGKYLREHKKYFSNQQLETDLRFIVSVLKLKNGDSILDLACGHGRHTIALAKRGFKVDGLDLSSHLLGLAEKEAKVAGVKINWYQQDVHRWQRPKRYDKIFLFFSEFGLFDAPKVIARIAAHLKPGGLFLLDTDNVFRLISYLKKHPRGRYRFDFRMMELKEKGARLRVRYYTLPDLEELFRQSHLKTVAVYGGYRREPFDIKAGRQIVVVKKV